MKKGRRKGWREEKYVKIKATEKESLVFYFHEHYRCAPPQRDVGWLLVLDVY